MKEENRLARNVQRMSDLYPTFRSRLAVVIKAMEARGYRPRIQDAYRSPEDQRAAYEAGHTKLLFGFHNVTGKNGQPEALAVAMLDDDFPLNPRRKYLLCLAFEAQQAGLTTGVRWGLSDDMAAAIDKAIATQTWDAPVKIGWDPTHVQPLDLTVDMAKAGKRPA